MGTLNENRMESAVCGLREPNPGRASPATGRPDRLRRRAVGLIRACLLGGLPAVVAAPALAQTTHVGNHDDSGTGSAPMAGAPTTAGNDAGPLASAASGLVARANSPAAGQPDIEGTPQVGQTLSARLGDISDGDGLPTFPDDFSFQWMRVDGGAETNVGTDSETYDPVAGDVGKAIKVEATFADGAGHGEGPLASDATEAVAAEQEDCATDRPGNDWCAQMTAEGLLPEVYRFLGFNPNVGYGSLDDTTIEYGIASFEVELILSMERLAPSLDNQVAARFSAELPRGSVLDFGGFEFTTGAAAWGTYVWIVPAALPWLDGQKVTVSANIAPVPEAATVTGNTLVLTYFEDLDGGSDPAGSAFTVAVKGSAGPSVSSADVSGNTVTLTLAAAVPAGPTAVSYAPPSSNPVKDHSDLAGPAFDDFPVVNDTPNSPAAGAPSITGTARQGQVLSADTGGISDPDGKARADDGESGFAYAYQWFRVDSDGTSGKTAISGATGRTYTLTADEAGGKTIVEVRFTDDAGFAEGPLASAAHPSTGTVARRLGSDASLSALALRDPQGDAIPLSPAFAPATTTYSATVASSATLATVAPTRSDPDATHRILDAGNAALGDASTAPGFQVRIAPGANTFKVEVTAADGNTVRTYTVAVTSRVPSLRFASADYAAKESAGGAVVTVELKPPAAGAVTVSLTATNQGGATAADYSGVPPRVTFAAGETEATFTVTALEDSLAETGESVRIGLGTAPAGTVLGSPAETTVTLEDVDAVRAVAVSFGEPAYTAVEGGADATVEVRLSTAPGRSLSIPLTQWLRSTSSADYSGVPRSVAFGPNQRARTFVVEAVDDNWDDDLESVVLGFGEADRHDQLGGGPLPEAVSVGIPGETTVHLEDNDGERPTRTLYMDAANTVARTVAEGRTYSLGASLDEAAPGPLRIPLEVEYTGGATAADITGVPGVLTIAAGGREGNVLVTGVDDSEADPGEGFVVTFGDLPAGVQADDRYSVATFSIHDNDEDPNVPERAARFDGLSRADERGNYCWSPGPLFKGSTVVDLTVHDGEDADYDLCVWSMDTFDPDVYDDVYDPMEDCSDAVGILGTSDYLLGASATEYDERVTATLGDSAVCVVNGGHKPASWDLVLRTDPDGIARDALPAFPEAAPDCGLDAADATSKSGYAAPKAGQAPFRRPWDDVNSMWLAPHRYFSFVYGTGTDEWGRTVDRTVGIYVDQCMWDAYGDFLNDGQRCDIEYDSMRRVTAVANCAAD